MVLVTGGTGLVGGHLLWFLAQTNEKIVAIRRTTSNIECLRSVFGFYSYEPDKYLSKIEWHTADILNSESLKKLISQNTVIYHCAAVVSLQKGKKQNSLIETNISGTQNIVNAALEANAKKLCFVSSIAACGDSKNGDPIEETTYRDESRARSSYSLSKYTAEKIVWKAARKGLAVVIVNPGVILGYSMQTGGSSQLFHQVKKGLPFYTNGGTGYIDVADVVKAMIKLTNSNIKNERFILVSESCSNKEILTLIAQGFNKRKPFILAPKGLLVSVGFILEKTGKLFGFSPLIDIQTARTASNRNYYSNAKIRQTIDIEFTPMSVSIGKICEAMRKEGNFKSG